jgi:predicted nucleic acid-binding protein
MSKFIIADTSCLISLSNTKSLYVLEKVFSEIYITQEIKAEFNEKLPKWIKVISVNKEKLIKFSKMLDIGEASAIALAIENPNSTLILDDRKGRKIAQKYNIEIIGTIGLLLKAEKSGAIKDAFPIIMQMINNGFRISSAVLDKLIKIYSK